MGGLNWIVKSRLRFKSVCIFWPSLIRRRSLVQSTLIRDLYTATNTNNDFKSSSSKFGTFLFHVSGPSCFQGLQENTILRISSRTEFEPEVKSLSPLISGGWCWSTDDRNVWNPCDAYFDVQDISHKIKSGKYDDYVEENMFKVFSNQHQHHLVFYLLHTWIPPWYKYFEYPKYIVGSCDGLICLFDREHMDISLWNPDTTQFRILPKWITIENLETERFREVPHYLVALGFDVETKDHKVLVVIWSSPRPSSQECHCRVQIYSLSTDSWRLLEDINSLPGTPINNHYQALYHSRIYHSVYLNGSCFFMANFYPSQPMFGKFIISFDFTKEFFTTMPFPDHDEKQELFLSSLGEKLALFSVCHQSPIVYPMGLMVQA